jgi:endonuclease YncB( thermonuclease family)
VSTSSAASTASSRLPRALAALLAVAAAPPLPSGAASQSPDCAPGLETARAVIRTVIDGDTVILEDGAHVRLVGIDTPELGHGDGPDQPGAVAARDWLAARLARGTAVLAGADREDRDRHGRLLRHLYLADGTNLQAALLESGLATPLTIPPSLGHLSCYRRAAATAEHAAAGLWGRAEYRPVAPRSLAANTRGFRIVLSRVVETGAARGGFRLQLEGTLSAYVPQASVAAFDGKMLGGLAGQVVEVRGMVYPWRGRLRLFLYHPLDLRIVTGTGNPAAPQASN